MILFACCNLGNGKLIMRDIDITPRTVYFASKKDIGLITKRDLLMFGLGLCLGEGSKAYESVVIVNADPRVIRLAIAWFRITYGLSTKNFTLTIHMYPDNEVDKTHSFWLKQTGLPTKQLRKTQIDRRENKRPIKHGKLPYGTAHLRIVASGNKRFGKSLHPQIMTSIDTIIDQTIKT